MTALPAAEGLLNSGPFGSTKYSRPPCSTTSQVCCSLSIRIPSEVLADLARGSGREFYEQAGVSFPVPGLSDVNGFYIPSLGGPNGVADPRLGTFFVIDQPTVFDRRVSAHEVGHLLGLSHDTVYSRLRRFFQQSFAL